MFDKDTLFAKNLYSLNSTKKAKYKIGDSDNFFF